MRRLRPTNTPTTRRRPRRRAPRWRRAATRRAPSAASAPASYARFCRPKLAQLLECLRLDVTYEKASGNYLYRRATPDSELTPVLDLVGGFGACLLGHNHPELKRALRQQLDQDVPMLAQSAVRAGAARLAEQLNRLVPADGQYLCNFTNSGAESVEAAIKHAYKVRFDAIRRTFEAVTRQVGDVCAEIERAPSRVELPAARADSSAFRDEIDELNLAQFERFRRSPQMIALKGAFHGKTSAALKVTFNKSYREGYEGLSAIEPIFVDPADVERLPEIVAEQRIEFLVPRLVGRKVVLERVSMSRAIGLIFEVIMGEGGIVALPDATLETLARLHADLDLPYIIDEVQTGCGRTGALFAYSQTALAAIEPEYLTLSKALGGGLVKIGATMIHQRVYDPDFGILHTSTFAEDDIACAVASRALDIITRDGGKLMAQVERKGAYLVERLRDLASKYPTIIREVRGRGLMIGIELAQLQDRSPLFRYASRQGFLSLMVASYLLHHHQIRVLAPLTTLLKGNPGKKRRSVLRIQPSAYVTRAQMDRTIAALDEVLSVIERNDEFLLVAHLVGETPTPQQRRAATRVEVAYPLPTRREDFDARVGFVLHPTSLAHVLRYYFPSFTRYGWDEGRVTRWWTHLAPFLEPDAVHVAYVERDDFVVEVNFIVVPYLPQQMMRTLVAARRGRQGQRALEQMQDKIQDAVTIARELGDDAVPTSMVGLGAFTSILTDRGTSINDYEVPVTTGNAFTAALMLMAIDRTAAERGLAPDSTTTAVVGAAGNIGSVLAALLCERSAHIKLIGRQRDDGVERLTQVRQSCMRYLLERVQRALGDGEALDELRLTGLAQRIVDDVLRPALRSDAPRAELATLRSVLYGEQRPTREHAALLDRIVAAYYGDDALFSLHTELSSLDDCDIVAVATSSTNAQLVAPHGVKKGAIVCSASVPSNLSRAFADQLDEYCVFDGGLARLPAGNAIDWIGMPSGGLAFGCLSETVVLGFEGHEKTFAKGDLSPEQVRISAELGRLHGFTLGDLKLGESVHPMTSSSTSAARQ